MREQGREKIYSLKRGIADWLRKGFKVAKGRTSSRFKDMGVK